MGHQSKEIDGAWITTRQRRNDEKIKWQRSNASLLFFCDLRLRALLPMKGRPF